MPDTLRSLLARRVHLDEDKPFREWGDLVLHISVFDHWLSFYRDLASEGARVINGRRDKIVNVPASSGRLFRLIKDSVRERRLMDVIFNRFPTRVLGGYDRPDTFLPATRQERGHVADLALSHGLHTLD